MIANLNNMTQFCLSIKTSLKFNLISGRIFYRSFYRKNKVY
jgi:hypothetical protein